MPQGITSTMDSENTHEVNDTDKSPQIEAADLLEKESEGESSTLTNYAVRVEILEKMVQELRDELSELKDCIDKPVDDRNQAVSQTVMSAVQPKGINAPGGMSTEQLQEFKKQTLQINGLQQKMKDLEAKLIEAAVAIKKGNERATEMEEKGTENVKDLYSTIDQINNSLSEKIAQQRVEMQKIAGDTPKAINYDPFNYGEAYGGDFVDFQARKRITEIKILLHSLQANISTLRESVKVSPAVDLGYKVVRLDQLLATTGFREAIANGEATHEDAVVITHKAAREPGRLEMPRKEMFQTTEDMESKWAITDSIMQTMYRLEMELGEMQKIVGTSDISSNSKILEELQCSIRQLKEKQLDIKSVKRLIDDNMAQTIPKSRQSSVDATRFQVKDALPVFRDETTRPIQEESTRSMKNLESTVDKMYKRFKDIEAYFEKRPGAAVLKSRHGDLTSACLSCDRGIEPHFVKSKVLIPKSGLYDHTKGLHMQAFVKTPTRLKYVLNRAYNIDTSNITMDVYSIPRPCGAGYAVYWPVITESQAHKVLPQAEPVLLPNFNDQYIKGLDGHYYHANLDPALKSEYMKNRNVTVLKADRLSKVSTMKTDSGSTLVREINYSGKQAVITTSVPKKDRQKVCIQRHLMVDGEQKRRLSKIEAEKSETPVGEEKESITATPINEKEAKTEEEDNDAEKDVQDSVPREEFDNAAFFEDENMSANARLGFMKVHVFYPNNNNNAHDRVRQVASPHSTFTQIIELVSAANSPVEDWYPAATGVSKVAPQNDGAQVMNSKNVERLQQPETSRGLTIVNGDARKYGRGNELIKTQQNNVTPTASKFNRTWEAITEAKTSQQEQQLKEQQILKMEICRTAQKQPTKQIEKWHTAQKQQTSQLETCHIAREQQRLQLETCHTAREQQRLQLETCHTAREQQRLQLETCHTPREQQTSQLQTCHTALGQQTSQLETCHTPRRQQTSQLQTCHTALGQQTSQLETCYRARGQQTSQLGCCNTAKGQQTSQLETCHTAREQQRLQLETCHTPRRQQTSQLQTCHTALGQQTSQLETCYRARGQQTSQLGCCNTAKGQKTSQLGIYHTARQQLASQLRSCHTVRKQQMLQLKNCFTARKQQTPQLKICYTARGQQKSHLKSLRTAQQQQTSHLKTCDTVRKQQKSQIESSHTAQEQQILQLESYQTTRQQQTPHLNPLQTVRGQKTSQFDSFHTAQEEQTLPLESCHTPRNQKTPQLKTCHTAREQQVSQLGNSHTAREQQVSQLKSSHTAREQQVSQLKSSHTAREQQVPQLKSSHTEQEQQTLQLKSFYTARSQQMSQLKTVHTEREQQISQQETCLSAREQRLQLGNCHTAQEQKMSQLEDIDKVQKKQISHLKSCCTVQKQQISQRQFCLPRPKDPKLTQNCRPQSKVTVVTSDQQQPEHPRHQNTQPATQQAIMEKKTMEMDSKIKQFQRQKTCHQQRSDWNKEHLQSGQGLQQEQQDEHQQLPQAGMSRLSSLEHENTPPYQSNSDRELFQWQREEHLKLRSISHWLDYGVWDKRSSAKVNKGKNNTKVYTPRDNCSVTGKACLKTRISAECARKAMHNINMRQRQGNCCEDVVNGVQIKDKCQDVVLAERDCAKVKQQQHQVDSVESNSNKKNYIQILLVIPPQNCVWSQAGDSIMSEGRKVREQSEDSRNNVREDGKAEENSGRSSIHSLVNSKITYASSTHHMADNNLCSVPGCDSSFSSGTSSENPHSAEPSHCDGGNQVEETRIVNTSDFSEDVKSIISSDCQVLADRNTGEPKKSKSSTTFISKVLSSKPCVEDKDSCRKRCKAKSVISNKFLAELVKPLVNNLDEPSQYNQGRNVRPSCLSAAGEDCLFRSVKDTTEPSRRQDSRVKDMRNPQDTANVCEEVLRMANDAETCNKLTCMSPPPQNGYDKADSQLNITSLSDQPEGMDDIQHSTSLDECHMLQKCTSKTNVLNSNQIGLNIKNTLAPNLANDNYGEVESRTFNVDPLSVSLSENCCFSVPNQDNVTGGLQICQKKSDIILETPGELCTKEDNTRNCCFNESMNEVCSISKCPIENRSSLPQQNPYWQQYNNIKHGDQISPNYSSVTRVEGGDKSTVETDKLAGAYHASSTILNGNCTSFQCFGNIGRKSLQSRFKLTRLQRRQREDFWRKSDNSFIMQVTSHLLGNMSNCKLPVVCTGDDRSRIFPAQEITKFLESQQ